jgi:hypothetical protein
MGRQVIREETREDADDIDLIVKLLLDLNGIAEDPRERAILLRITPPLRRLKERAKARQERMTPRRSER